MFTYQVCPFSLAHKPLTHNVAISHEIPLTNVEQIGIVINLMYIMYHYNALYTNNVLSYF